MDDNKKSYNFFIDMLISYKSMWTNYARFSGRTSRREFWLAQLMDYIIVFIFWGICMTLRYEWLAWLYNIFNLAAFLPRLAICARRLHDTNRSARWLLFQLLGLAGAIFLLIKYCEKSVDEGNRFNEK